MVRENENVVEVDDLSLVLRKDAGFFFIYLSQFINIRVCIVYKETYQCNYIFLVMAFHSVKQVNSVITSAREVMFYLA